MAICNGLITSIFLETIILSKQMIIKKALQKDLKLSLIFFTHDLSIAKHISDNILVLYFRKTVEMSSSKELFKNPQHKYTKKLISSVPIPDPILN